MRIVENDTRIESLILSAIADTLNVGLRKGTIKIEKQIRDLVRRAIQSSPEYQSLAHGQLQGEFGIVDSQARLDIILKIWINSITVSVNPVKRSGGQLKGGIRLEMISGDYQDVINIPEAYVITEKGTRLNWLEWLLLFGDRSIIRDYTIGIDQERSRTGVNIMVKAKNKRWAVPPQFSGTINKNFVTRTLDPLDAQITKIVEDGIESSL